MSGKKRYKDFPNFKPLKETDLDYEPGKGDWFMEMEDEKGKFWISKPVYGDDEVDPKLMPKD